MSKDCNNWECSRTRAVDDVNCDRDCCRCKKDCCRCEERHPEAKPVILAADTGEDVTLINGYCPDNNHHCKEEIASVAIDTTSLSDPIVKIDFSTNIIFKGTDINCPPIVNTFVRVKFKLVKCCNGCTEKIGTWEYYRYFADALDFAIARSLSDTFTFSYCINESCPGCCVYKVIAKVESCDDVDELSCKKNTISAIAQSQ